jgi:hypothetical protein
VTMDPAVRSTLMTVHDTFLPLLASSVVIYRDTALLIRQFDFVFVKIL